MKKHIYIFSGLGADQRVFQRLRFGDCNITHIEWIRPTEDDVLESYAFRLIEQIDHYDCILIGVSFGGMVAVEVAKIIQPHKTILISTAKVSSEIPFYLRLAGRVRLHRLLPLRFIKQTNCISYWLFGVYDQSDKELLKQIFSDTDEWFLKKTIDMILNWKNETILDGTYQLHGTKDRILPVRNHRLVTKVEAGGHLMILNKSDNVNKLIETILID